MNDILLNENSDLIIENGDFAIGNSDNQNQHLIIISEKGEFKEYPEIGVGIERMLNDDEYMELLIEVKKNLEYDGMRVDDVKFTQEGKLLIEGKYK